MILIIIPNVHQKHFSNNFNNFFIQKYRINQGIFNYSRQQRQRDRRIKLRLRAQKHRKMSLQNATQIQEQQKALRVQQKIKLMMKNKKLQKLTSEKDLASEKPLSLYNDFPQKKFDEIYSRKNIVLQNNPRYEQTFEPNSNKRLKSTAVGEQFTSLASINLKQQSKRFNPSNKGKAVLFQTQALKKTPSIQKIQSQSSFNKGSKSKLKRPSSVLNKSTRNTTSRTRRQKPLQIQDQKAMQIKIRSLISKSFQYGLKLQKYAQQKKIDLGKQEELLFSSEIDILRLINNSKQYYILGTQNEQEQDGKLASGIEKQIIEILKKRKDKQAIISKCQQTSDRISMLLEKRLNVLHQSKTFLA